MRILLVGKHRLISRFTESHILNQVPLADITVLTPWELKDISGTYDLIVVNNISLNDNLDMAVSILEPHAASPDALILLSTPEFIRPGDRFNSLDPAEDPDEFNRIIRRAAGLEEDRSEMTMEEFMSRYALACRDRETIRKLTTRQLYILQLILSGLSYQEVADRLDVSINAVKKHMTSVYKKTELKNRAELFLLFRNERRKKHRRKEDGSIRRAQ